MSRLHLEINSDSVPADGQVATYNASAAEWQAANAIWNARFGYFGSGAHGDVNIAGTVTLARTMFYRNLTINNGDIVQPLGYKIYVSGTLTIDAGGIIRHNGANGGNAATFNAGAAGAGSTTSVNFDLGNRSAGQIGGVGQAAVGSAPGAVALTNGARAGGARRAGGAGGAGTPNAGGAGGTGGAGYVTPVLFDLLTTEVAYGAGVIHGGEGGGGGGGGGGDGVNRGGGGGGGGSGGGVIFIAARHIVNAGTISANGGNGGNGANGVAGNSGGGGAGTGGSGGLIYLLYDDITVGTITVAGGTPGAVGNGSGTGVAGSAGQTGNVGKITRYNMLTGLFE